MKKSLRMAMILSLLLTSLLTVYGVRPAWADTLLSESCSTQPGDWTFYNVSQESGYWLIDDNSDYVISTQLNLSGYTNLELVSNLRSYGNGTAPTALIELSDDNGSTWMAGSTTHANIPNSYTDYTWDIGSVDSNQVKIRWTRSGGTRGLRINTITLTGDPPSGGPDDPDSFSATTASTSQIDLAFTTNGSGDMVVIVYDLDNTFDTPSGSPPAVGEAFAGGTVVYKGTTSPQSHTSLSEGTQYYYKAWSNDGSDNYSSGLTDDARTLKGESTNHVTGFSATADSGTAVTVNWTDATGGTVPDGYLVKGSTTSYAAITAPSDGTAESDDTDFSDGSGVINVAAGTQTYQWTGLTSSTTYYFKIWPYTNSGSDIDYKTDGTVPQANATTPAGPSTPTTGDLVINEIMYNPSTSEPSTEWFEVKNVSGGDLDIDGCTISDAASNSHTISGASNVSDGDYYIFGASSSITGVTVDYVYGTGVVLNNDGDTVKIVCSSTTIDQVDYDDGNSWPSSTNGTAISFGVPTGSTDYHIDNDSADNWKHSTTEIGGGNTDKGTPGAVNDDVLGVTAVTIHSITVSSAGTPTLALVLVVGLLVLVSGAAVPALFAGRRWQN